MGKKRVHEVAKELKLESKELMQRLADLGIEVKSHMSTLTEQEIKRVRQSLAGKQGETKQSAPEAAGKPKAVRLSQYGPGLVDRVPQRPPDRTFVERPFAFPIRPAPPRPEKKEPEPGAQQPGAESVPSLTKTTEPAPPPPVSHIPAPKEKQPKPVTPTPPRETARQAEKPVPPKAGARGPKPGRDRGESRPAPPRGPRPAERRHARVPEVGEHRIPERPKEVRPVEKKERPRVFDTKERKRSPWEYEKEAKLKLQPPRRPRQEIQPQTAVGERKPLVLPEALTVKELAEKMHIKAADLIKKLMELGVLATINQEIDADTAAIVAGEYGYEVEFKKELQIEDLIAQNGEFAHLPWEPRPCVVTVMGHVDHGKTSLLDAIRKTNVTATEAGGITQHIGAYQVEHNNRKITFLDTPGHEAFTAMRARGARATDIAVLVVAADDGVKPQTVEAINHARAAQVPIIVAINKIDKPEANPDRVKQQLAELGLVPEEWGGDTICVPVSALKKEGIKDLLEMILLVAEMSDLKAQPGRPARGTIIESRLDKGRGPVATVLVQDGTLEVGNALVAGHTFARVRAMMDDKGRRLKAASPSTPVEVLGFSELPQAGDQFHVVTDEKLARHLLAKRQARRRHDELKGERLTLEDVFKRIQEGKVKELPLIVKADVQGSVEALCQALEGIGTEEVRVRLMHAGVGNVSETDVMLASASNAIIIAFNVRADINARRAAERENVEIRTYQVIYDAIDDVKAALAGLLEPEFKEVTIGHAEVRKVFTASRVGVIAGCYILEGKVTRDASVRVLRDGDLLHAGKISSLKRFKDDVKEVTQGYECGIMVDKFEDFQEGDRLEFFVTEAVKRELA
ncbi:MAG: translation initiation factor IF-2 [Desulfotomaculales bacterium]